MVPRRSGEDGALGRPGCGVKGRSRAPACATGPARGGGVMASGRLRGETAFQRQRCGPAGSQGPPLRAAELRAAEKTAEPRPQRLGSTLAALTRSRKAEGTENIATQTSRASSHWVCRRWSCGVSGSVVSNTLRPRGLYRLPLSLGFSDAIP